MHNTKVLVQVQMESISEVIENGVALANGTPAEEIDFAEQDSDFDESTLRCTR